MVFVPLKDAYAHTGTARLPGTAFPAPHRLVGIVTDLAATTDLTEDR